MVGNITKERAIKIVEDAESIFKKRGTNVQPLAKTAFTEVRYSYIVNFFGANYCFLS